MRPPWKIDPDGVTRPDVASGNHNRHHACLAYDAAMPIAAGDGTEQPRLKSLDLDAGIPEPGHLDDRALAESKPSAFRKRKQIDAARGDVLAQVPGMHSESLGRELVEQLSVNEVNLPQVGLQGITRDARAVFDCGAAVRITLDAESGFECDEQLGALAE